MTTSRGAFALAEAHDGGRIARLAHLKRVDPAPAEPHAAHASISSEMAAGPPIFRGPLPETRGDDRCD